MRCIIPAMVFVFLAAAGICLAGQAAFMPTGEGLIPEPELMAPITSEADLTGRDSLLFRWSPYQAGVSDRRYYDFRLYKGGQMLENALIMKEQLPPTKYEYSVSAATFEDGELYTWSLKQVCWRGKSRRSDHTFKVIKKQQENL